MKRASAAATSSSCRARAADSRSLAAWATVPRIAPTPPSSRAASARNSPCRARTSRRATPHSTPTANTQASSPAPAPQSADCARAAPSVGAIAAPAPAPRAGSSTTGTTRIGPRKIDAARQLLRASMRAVRSAIPVFISAASAGDLVSASVARTGCRYERTSASASATVARTCFSNASSNSDWPSRHLRIAGSAASSTLSAIQMRSSYLARVSSSVFSACRSASERTFSSSVRTRSASDAAKASISAFRRAQSARIARSPSARDSATVATACSFMRRLSARRRAACASAAAIASWRSRAPRYRRSTSPRSPSNGV